MLVKRIARSMAAWTATWIVALLGFAAFAPAAEREAAPPASTRYASSEQVETPSFRRHVVPLLGRLGCNGRACHGSFQGQGGFRLSLFGYDFAADHEALVGGERPRVDLQETAKSLVLQKPTLTIDHEGGRRFELDGWQHRLLSRWIEGGAAGLQSDEAEFASLEVEPREIVFARGGQTAELKIVACWSDGSREDVTPLCRFRSNDESIATVSESGTITAAGKGDTHIVVFYDNGIVPVQVMLPWSESAGPKYPSVPAPTPIDELVVGKLRKLGVVPSELCTDAEFLRRASLDVTGTLPMPEEILAFEADRSSDKRQRKIDELLSRPAYAAWWATRLCDFTGNTELGGPEGSEKAFRRELSDQWYDWIHRRVAENVPYDELVEGIVIATSRRPGQSDDEYFAEMSSYFREEDRVDFSRRDNMPYFWNRGRFSPPVTLRFSYAFLGARLECAECHKHPFDQWTKQDFEQFKAFFDGVKYNNSARNRTKQLRDELGLTGDEDSGQFQREFAKLAREGKVVPWKEVMVTGQRKTSKPGKRKGPSGRVITPKLLGGEEVLASQYDDPRQPLMDWLRQPENPYFARAFVNRVWASYFNVGIIEPPDDLNLANPPSNAALLDWLAENFVREGYDMKWLHRQIAGSRTYQLSWRPNDTNRLDTRNFSRAVLRRLPAEVTYDALVQATAGDAALEKHFDEPRSRAIGVASGYTRSHPAAYAMTLFGKPARAAVCDCERSNEPTLLQAVFLNNDEECLKLIERKEGWLTQAADSELEPDELIRQAYLRTVSRLPEEHELSAARRYLAEADDKRSGLRDLLWALINTKEFILNR